MWIFVAWCLDFDPVRVILADHLPNGFLSDVYARLNVQKDLKISLPPKHRNQFRVTVKKFGLSAYFWSSAATFEEGLCHFGKKKNKREREREREKT